MGIFWTSKKCISRHKFEKEIRIHLYDIGFSHKEIDHIEEIFRSDLDDKDPGCDYAGLTKEEVDSGITWMRKHMDVHKLPENKIDQLEEAFKKYF